MEIKMKMHRKGYYFSIEATLGILILASSFFVVLYFAESAVPVPEYRYAQNIAGYLGSVTLGEFCSDGCEGLGIGGLDLYDYTLMDIIGYKYSQTVGGAANVTGEIITRGELLLRGKNIGITITDIACDILFSTEDMSCEEGVNKTNEVVFRKVIQGFVIDEDSNELEFWGDYVFEVRVW